MALHSIELFAGGGGLALGLDAVGVRTVCYVEREAYAAAVLAARMAEGRLAPAPVWSDVRTFDGRRWRGVVDLVAGGFPCQDISHAGKGAGIINGERSGLWREFARIVSETRPTYVFVENVSALRSRGLDVVLGDLASLGFDAEWGCVRASDVGAPHRRERIFILAHASGTDQRWRSARTGWRGEGPGDAGGGQRRAERWSGSVVGWRREATDDAGERVVDADESRLAGWSMRNGERTDSGASRPTGDALADPTGIQQGEGGEQRTKIDGSGPCSQTGSLPRVPWPPRPQDADGWRAYLERWPGLEPAVRRGADGLASRVDRLRALGNGVVPQQAAIAWRVLWDRIHSGV